MRWTLAGCLGLGVGCDPGAPGAPPDPKPPTTLSSPTSTGSGDELESACGITHVVDMTISGVVVDAAWRGVSGAEVWLEERDWGPTVVRGSGLSHEDGAFLFEIEQVPIIEGCWGIGPQFHVVADDGLRIGEIPVNMQIVFAWLDGSLEANAAGLPCQIRAPR
ncbi:MAG TPA: hypothetical protein ENK18_03485 [Deltaproteobacteria bacterium]|nr:hypothetical protein [Deltaproteobacteria bacterium]